ncbi:DUF4132 domain-containing protein [Chitinophaga barathri]|uniref:DUF4132 domain-containing protein n=1 Tax=Chitinophaga barathri TaxID=1647451 RepID=A0A3N4MRA3_9BACT|nr:DUF4132 domain-containing protein [Chitinophaga barathri]RPD42109.1 DUF4132 domain-containing protein [Chitinophaga barathri]
MGIFDFLKNKNSGNKPAAGNDAPPEKSQPPGDTRSFYLAIGEAAHQEMLHERAINSISPFTDKKVFKERIQPLTDKEKVALIVTATQELHALMTDHTKFNTSKGNQMYHLWTFIIEATIKEKMNLDDEDIHTLVTVFSSYQCTHHDNNHISHWPIMQLISQLDKIKPEGPVSDTLRSALSTLKEKLEAPAAYHLRKDQTKQLAKLGPVYARLMQTDGGPVPVYFRGNDIFSDYANQYLRGLSGAEAGHWARLMIHTQKASGSKPSNKFLTEGGALIRALGEDAFHEKINDWLVFLAAMKDSEEDNGYGYTCTTYLHSGIFDHVRGFVWICSYYSDKTTLFNIAALAERAFRKIPQTGPAAPALGNACLFALANSEGMGGIGHLSRLKLRIRQNNTQGIIEKYLVEAAIAQGVSTHDIEDMAVEDHGFEDGKITFSFDSASAVLQLTGTGKTALNWFKADGTPQKSVPAQVKEQHAETLKTIKEIIKQSEATLSAQRDRMDRFFRIDRSIPWPHFKTYYFNHPLLGYIARKLIWTVEHEGIQHHVIYHNDTWLDQEGHAVALTPGEQTHFTLWHPVHHSAAVIRQWRDFLMQEQIVQPVKQAFREIYLLTDAEVNTLSYSNRMAAHILRQHQFNSLAKLRGWKYALRGSFDGGSEEVATLLLPDFNLRAEYWIHAVQDQEHILPSGMYEYIATDQLRFINTFTRETVSLPEVPAVALSEVMRDADLFVGVASVGNDPNWTDSGGIPRYRDYWYTYSFGELTEVAKTRRYILENLVPRLKIAPVTTLQDKFLVVKGKLRTYKIHLGSTNILMEPNDQYLCIVAVRSAKEPGGSFFLPFEGDAGLSLILSKAILLAEDDKIKDVTITRQINRL